MGKTAVFVLATLQQLEPVDGNVSVIVMCHTRELAFQISKEYERFSKYMDSMKVLRKLIRFSEILPEIFRLPSSSVVCQLKRTRKFWRRTAHTLLSVLPDVFWDWSVLRPSISKTSNISSLTSATKCLTPLVSFREIYLKLFRVNERLTWHSNSQNLSKI